MLIWVSSIWLRLVWQTVWHIPKLRFMQSKIDHSVFIWHLTKEKEEIIVAIATDNMAVTGNTDQTWSCCMHNIHQSKGIHQRHGSQIGLTSAKPPCSLTSPTNNCNSCQLSMPKCQRFPMETWLVMFYGPSWYPDQTHCLPLEFSPNLSQALDLLTWKPWNDQFHTYIPQETVGLPLEARMWKLLHTPMQTTHNSPIFIPSQDIAYNLELAQSVGAWGEEKNTLLSMESKYVGHTHTMKEIVWIQNFGAEIDENPIIGWTLLKADNQGVIELSNDNKFHAHTKHIDMQHHFIWEVIKNKVLDIQYVPTDGKYCRHIYQSTSQTNFWEVSRNVGTMLCLRSVEVITNILTFYSIFLIQASYNKCHQYLAESSHLLTRSWDIHILQIYSYPTYRADIHYTSKFPLVLLICTYCISISAQNVIKWHK